MILTATVPEPSHARMLAETIDTLADIEQHVAEADEAMDDALDLIERMRAWAMPGTRLRADAEALLARHGRAL